MAETSSADPLIKPPIAPSVTSILDQTAGKWQACEGLAGSDLLRLALLRDLLHQLHAQKSRSLSTGKRDDALSILGIETRIEELRTGKPLGGDFRELIFGHRKLKKRTHSLPGALFKALDREKLERYDRQWEATLASEALAQGWRVWSLETWIEIPRIDHWNRRLVDSLWPDGIVLYVESAGQSPERDARSQGEGDPSWLGRWICLLRAKFETPSNIPLDFAQWEGTRSHPSLRIVFSPKSP